MSSLISPSSLSFNERAFYSVYRWFAWPTLRFTLGLLSYFLPKVAKGLELREPVNGREPWIKLLPPSQPTVWFHCASGEFEYAKPVITLIKTQLPDIQIVVTYFSPTYADQIRKFAGVDWVVPLPWDSPWPLSQFLGSYRPFALLVARTDVWPEMARQARVRNLRSALFSATLTQSSGRTRGIGRWATRATLNQLDDVFGATIEDADAFRALDLKRPQITQAGDTRYDQVIKRLESPKPTRDNIFFNIARDLFVCGSTWSEDEDVLIPALEEMKESICGVLIPHEPTPDHILRLEAKLRARGLAMVLYSDPAAPEKMRLPSTCLVVDQTGILAELYLKGRWAFVGGSFRKTVHSVMEPLAAGCLTFVGPLHSNNREAISFQNFELSSGLSFVTVVKTPEGLVKDLKEAQSLPDFKTKIREAVRERTGSSQIVVDWLRRNL